MLQPYHRYNKIKFKISEDFFKISDFILFYYICDTAVALYNLTWLHRYRNVTGRYYRREDLTVYRPAYRKWPRYVNVSVAICIICIVYLPSSFIVLEKLGFYNCVPSREFLCVLSCNCGKVSVFWIVIAEI